jgi:hypothetical protein
MSFNVAVTCNVTKTVGTSSEMLFPSSYTIACNRETLYTLDMPYKASDNYVRIDLTAFTVDSTSSKLILIESSKNIYVKANIPGTPSDQEIYDFPGVLMENFSIINGKLTNLYLARINGDVDTATVKIRIFG